jgi:LysR family glycine cleavage system transcriptional activator
MAERRRPRLSLDLLRGFRAAARHLSFTRAAQELSVTQSAISREIKTLEEQIGQPLFQRGSRTLELTRAGEELYRIADEALTLLDAGTDRLIGAGRTLAVTTTTGLSSLWLAPRLPRFNRAHPGIDVRIVASNDKPDLERDQLDVAIRFVGAGGDRPDAEQLMTCESFPACAPALARDPARPLRTPADLARHVRLDYETVRDGRRLSEWDFWFDAMKIRPVDPASTLRFPQFDQVFPAAIDGAGVAMGVLPHVGPQLRDGRLCAPFGRELIANRGAFFVVVRPDVAGRDAVKGFVAWLRSEVQRDAERTPVRDGPPSRRRAQAPRARSD